MQAPSMGSMALDFSDKFAWQLRLCTPQHPRIQHTITEKHAAPHHHIRPADFRRRGAKYRIAYDENIDFFHTKNNFLDPLTGLCESFAELCKHIMHGGNVQFGNYVYELPGLDECVLRGNHDFLQKY